MRLVMIEDHELLAQSLQAALSAENIEILRVWSDDRDKLLAEALDNAPGLLLLDYQLGPDVGDAKGLIEPLREAGYDVVMLTGVTDPVTLAECLEEGAIGVIDKTVSFDELLDNIRTVVEDGELMSRHEREEMLSVLRSHRASREKTMRPFEALTAREAEVLGDVAGALGIDVAPFLRRVGRDPGLRSEVNTRLRAGVGRPGPATTTPDAGAGPPVRQHGRL